MKRAPLLCYCYSVTEEEVRDAILTGAGTLAALRETLKVSSCCGSCEPRLRDCLADVGSRINPAVPAATSAVPAPAGTEFSPN